MDNSVNSQLIDFLACPDCSSDITIHDEQLMCINCKRSFEVRNGIPCLYSSSINVAHLHEEESLAEKMRRDPSDKKDQFNFAQWEKSKQAFWRMVKNCVKGNEKAYINIGCGYDSNYIEYEKNGNIFVNFDLVYKMLASLKQDYGAKSCVAGDINQLPFKKAVFDYVISIDVIHHECDNVKSIIKSFADILKPDGILFLEDPNAWGIFQVPKSIILPRKLYQLTRRIYHKLKKSSHSPADYEFPTSVWKTKDLLENLGFTDIEVYPNNSYPCISANAFQIYKLLSSIEYIKKYNNYHYMISAKKKY